MIHRFIGLNDRLVLAAVVVAYLKKTKNAARTFALAEDYHPIGQRH